MLEDLSAGFVELKRDEVLTTVTARVERGEDAIGILEDARRAMVTHHPWLHAALLNHRPCRCQRAVKDGYAAFWGQGFLQRPQDVWRTVASTGGDLADSLAANAGQVAIQQACQPTQHCRYAARFMQVDHRQGRGWFELPQQGNLPPDLVEGPKVELKAQFLR